MKSGRIAEAREALETAKKIDPNLEETKVLLGNLHDELTFEPKKGTRKRGRSAKREKRGKSSGKATTKEKSSKKKKKKQ